MDQVTLALSGMAEGTIFRDQRFELKGRATFLSTAVPGLSATEDLSIATYIRDGRTTVGPAAGQSPASSPVPRPASAPPSLAG